MNKRVQLVSNVLIGCIVLAITIFIFLSGNEGLKTSLNWIALVFVLISELVFWGYSLYFMLSASGSNKRIIRSGILSVLFVYLLISIFLGSVSNGFEKAQNTYLIINFMLMGVAASISILLNALALKTAVIDAKTTNAQLLIQEIENRLFSLKTNTANAEFLQSISSVHEKFKTIDQTIHSQYDTTLRDELNILASVVNGSENDKSSRIEILVMRLSKIIEQRNFEVSQGRRGGF